MIGSGKFSAQLEIIEALLKKLQLFGVRERYPNRNRNAADYRGLNYIDNYKKYISEINYDFILSDQSILLFDFKGKNIHDGMLSFCYVEAPVESITYREFVINLFDLDLGGGDLEVQIEEIGDVCSEEYETYLATLPMRRGVCPIRFDCDSSAYRDGVHPACHVHIGYENDMRVGVRRVLNPLSFVLFILRQRYPKAWQAIREYEIFPSLRKEIRSDLVEVDSAYWSAIDEDEMYLH